MNVIQYLSEEDKKEVNECVDGMDNIIDFMTDNTIMHEDYNQVDFPHKKEFITSLAKSMKWLRKFIELGKK